MDLRKSETTKLNAAEPLKANHCIYISYFISASPRRTKQLRVSKFAESLESSYECYLLLRTGLKQRVSRPAAGGLVRLRDHQRSPLTQTGNIIPSFRVCFTGQLGELPDYCSAVPQQCTSNTTGCTFMTAERPGLPRARKMELAILYFDKFLNLKY